MKRMDRYEEDVQSNNNSSRLANNQELYHNLSSNAIYANVTDVTNANAFEINNQANDARTSREAYQQMQKYQTVEPMPKSKKELEDVNYLSQKKENKTYDINSFLEEARRNRTEKDELDDKRKLKDNAYNILASINKEQLEKYREEKKNRVRTPEEEELHGIAEELLSKTMAGEIDKETTVDLLSDLMATNLLDTVSAATAIVDEEPIEETRETEKIEETITEEISQTLEPVPVTDEIKKPTRSERNTKDAFAQKDTDFYTRSMDLSDKDFELGSEFNDNKLPVIVKVIIAILVIAILVVAAYFIYQKLI